MWALKDDRRAGSMRSELDSPVGRKMFLLITSEWGGVSGRSHQDAVVLCCGLLCFQHIQHPASPSLPWPRSPGTFICKVTIIKTHPLVLLLLCLSSGPPRFLDSELWYEIQSSFIHNFFSLPSDRVWWSHVFWHAGRRCECLKVKNIESLKS